MSEPSLHEESLFLQALELGSAEEQAAFLDRECGAHAELRQGVEALLHHHQEGKGFLETPPTEVVEVGEHITTAVAETPALTFLATSSDPTSIGRLGHYEILEVLGSGGFGVVLKARDSKLDRIVAVKTLAQSLASSATARRRFVREAKAAAAVKHENVVGIYHVSDEGPVPYLVMECVSGLSLEQKLQQAGMLDVTAILRIGMQVASGLAAAHQQGLVHRDVKPANILLENGVERVKITDFGLARAANDAAITRTGDVAGTPQYMSPEQALGHSVDSRSDLFSLGSVLYAMCTGRSPFRAETTIAALRRVCDDTPRPIREINPEIPEWLVAIIDRLLEKKPNERFQSATEVADLLGQLLAQHQHPGSTLAAAPRARSVVRNATSTIAARSWTIATAALVLLFVGISLTEATGVTKVVTTVIRIVTGEGTLVVETDPDVHVTLEGNGELTFNLAGGQTVRIPTGSYRAKATKDGRPIPLEQDLVSITKGGREVVRVKLISGKSAGSNAAQDFKPLFNGHDLTGWATADGGTGNWKVEDSSLTCSGPQAHLLTVRDDFGDFHLRAEVKINGGGNSGMYFRTGKPLAIGGDYEAQITNNPNQYHKTGSLLQLVRVAESPVLPDTWFTLEIIAEGQRIRVLVNGKQTAEYSESRAGRNSHGHIALQHHDPETRVYFRKVEIKEFLPSKSAANGAFVLLVGDGAAERMFDTLADAVLAASQGGAIEVRGNGPFETSPITIRQPLVIRAGDGFRPVIRLRNGETGHVLLSSAPLVLEGLEIQYRREQLSGELLERDLHQRDGVIRCDNAPLTIANCRLMGDGKRSIVQAWVSPSAKIVNSELLNSAWDAVSWNCSSPAHLTIENCILAAPGTGRLTTTHRNNGPAEYSVSISRCTSLMGGGTLGFQCQTAPLEPQVPSSPRIAVNLVENVLDAPLPVVSLTPLDEFMTAVFDLPNDKRSLILPKLFAWREQYNLIRGGSEFCRWGMRNADGKESRSNVARDEWLTQFQLQETHSREGVPRFKGGDLRVRLAAAPLSLFPDDFRLAPDSPGYRAGPDGRDLGADVDLVGPGAAYERWKQTPEYQEWLKETGQLGMRPASKPEIGAFVLQAAGTKRKFDTLADAVQAASDGDTIEIRGHGPFPTQPIVVNQQSLTIRSGAGFQPVIQADPEEERQNLLSTSKHLTLEGLSFVWVNAKPDGKPHFLVGSSGPLSNVRALNCRFLMNRRAGMHNMHCIGAFDSALCRLQNCQLIVAGKGSSFPAIHFSGAPNGVLIVENCLVARDILISVSNRNPLKAVLKRNTQFGASFLTLRHYHEVDLNAQDPGPPVLEIVASGNILPGHMALVQLEKYLKSGSSFGGLDGQRVVKRLIDWQDSGNLYSSAESSQLLGLWLERSGAQRANLQLPMPITTLAAWQEFWGLDSRDALRGQAKFQTGDLNGKSTLTPELLSPGDFGLRPDSPGYGAGPDGKDLGADVELVGPGAAYERWKQKPEYQDWLKETGQFQAESPTSERGVFVILGGTGVAERQFNTLAEAVQRASDGDTIEIRGNGPFFSDPINIQRTTLTIRAGEGFRPVLKLSREAVLRDAPLLATDAALVLEGLELHRTPPAVNVGWRANCVVQSYQAPLRAANCRFRAKVSATYSPVRVFHNCEFFSDKSLYDGRCHPDTRVLFQNCLFWTKGIAISTYFDDAALHDVSTEVKGSTFVHSYTPLWLGLACPLPVAADGPRPFSLAISGSIFDAQPVLGFDQRPEFLAKAAVLPPKEDEAAFLRLLKWRGEWNLFPAGSASVRWAADGKLLPPRPPANLEGWKQFWSGAETDSLVGSVRFQGGNLLSRSEFDLDRLTPDDFRLREDSTGYHAGPDGKDLGADVDLVGPGAAYERWNQTPEYQEWLKETGQQK